MCSMVPRSTSPHLFLLLAAFAVGAVVAASSEESEAASLDSVVVRPSHRLLPTAAQNICGSSWSDALSCGAACPGGTNAECPQGQQCFAGVECPLPPTISPAPTRSPVKGFDIGNHDKQIIGYYASWQWYDRSKLAQPSNMDFNKVTRVTYAFFQLDEDGNIWGTDEWADPRVLYGDVELGGSCEPGSPRCRCSWVKPQYKSCSYHKDTTGLIWQVHKARAEIYPSIGGWTLSDAFPPMAANDQSRANFARKCRELIEDYGFDGIDLDWEYPGYAAHSGTPQDKANFNLLLRDVRRELDELGQETGQFYGLTAALPCGPSNINNIDIETVSQYLTEFNLMSYDFHGSWDATTGVNSPLYDQGSDPEAGWSVDGCVKNWVERGAPKDKLNIGLAFYGRSFLDANELGATHGGTDDTNWKVDEGTPQYFNLVDRIDEMTVAWDEETATPFAYFDTGGLVSYDDVQSICLKTEYAIEQDLNGFIIWELSGDVMDDLSTPLLDILNRKLVETDTDCADPFGPKLLSSSTTEENLLSNSDEIATTEATMATTKATSTPKTTTSTTASSAVMNTATTTATTKANTSAKATTTASALNVEEDFASSATGATVAAPTTQATQMQAPAAMLYFSQLADGRQKVRRDTNPPKKPYRPPKEGSEL